MLAKRVDDLPAAGTWIFEPKWDGFRALVFRDRDEIEIQSRDAKPLNRYFPELLEALASQLPARCVLDGEIVIATDGGLDFEALQLRLHPAASRVKLLSKQIPASIVFFDLLSEGHRDLRGEPFEERRHALEALLSSIAPPIHLTPATRESSVASDWFRRFEGAGLDGVIAKPISCASFSDEKRRELVEFLARYRIASDDNAALANHPWKQWSDHLAAESEAGHRMPGGQSRWSQGKDLSWEPLRPELVAEVAYEHMQATRFRHMAHFRRWRMDKKPDDCTYAQLEVVPPQELAAIFAGGR